MQGVGNGLKQEATQDGTDLPENFQVVDCNEKYMLAYPLEGSNFADSCLTRLTSSES